MRLAARAGSPRWSVRALESFDDAQARAFARLAETTHPGATRMLAACAEWLREHDKGDGRIIPLPLLVLDEDAHPALLLPMMLWHRSGLRHVLPARHRDAPKALTRAACPLPRPGLALSELEARAILHAVIAKLPPADLLTIALPRPGAHALSWRGLLHLLSSRLRGETARE